MSLSAAVKKIRTSNDHAGPKRKEAAYASTTSDKRRQECHGHGGRAARALGALGVSLRSPSLLMPCRSEPPPETAYRHVQGSRLSLSFFSDRVSRRNGTSRHGGTLREAAALRGPPLEAAEHVVFTPSFGDCTGMYVDVHVPRPGS